MNIKYSLKGCSPICSASIHGGMVVKKGNKIVILNKEMKKINHGAEIKRNRIYNFIEKFRFWERFLRLDIKCGISHENSIYFSWNRCLYQFSIKDNSVDKVHQFRKGMSGPLTLTSIYELSGFDNCICYGEYFQNNDRQAVKISGSMNGTHWITLYEFPKGTIRHIHGIIPDKKRKGVYILTGDLDNESGIWFASDNFKNVKPMLIGRQEYRTCRAYPNFPQDGILTYIMDSEYEDNFIKIFDLETSILKNIGFVSGTVIYGNEPGEIPIFSTTAEPSKNGKPMNRIIKLLRINQDMSIAVIGEFEKDLLPAKLQYGFVKIFQTDDENEIIIYPTAVKKYDGKLLKVSIDN